ncbi:MAG TPA: hypothetical protein VFS11_04360, partial [Gemmatimonadales bacterium]|nr:hypothetical protein [Gemmatimonadales bacterium]
MGMQAFAARARAGRLWARSRLRAAALLALLPAGLAAQQTPSSVVTGHVANSAGKPLAGAQVTIDQLGVGSTSRGDGTYTILVPGA